jgi:outer membrane protein
VKTPNRLVRVLGWVFLATTPASRADAEGPSAVGLRLGDVVEVTLSSSPDLALADAQIQVAEGSLLAARSAFDLKLETSITGSRSHEVDAKGAPTVLRELEYVQRAQRLFRSGFLITAETALVRRAFSTLPDEINSADVRAGVSIPLMRNRGGVIASAAEKAAERDRRATGWDRRHAAAERVLVAVTAYWDYQAAHRRLAVLRSSEERAKRSVDVTRVLVKADERTPADVVQMQGNLASKRVSRSSAEQAVAEARAALGLAMGLAAEAITTLASPATDFPRLADRSAQLDAGRLIDDAYGRRADLAAAAQDELAAKLRVDAAHSERLPRLDLSFSTGYDAAEVGTGPGDFFSPLRRREPELDALVQLTFELAVPNSGARGRTLQASSLREQSRIVTADLRRRIATAVVVAMEALARSEEAMRESEQAVRLFELGVRSVQSKFQLNAATLFDLIRAQDALTDAELSHVQSQRDYAVAVATLRFQSGHLVEGDDDALTVPLISLLRPP